MHPMRPKRFLCLCTLRQVHAIEEAESCSCIRPFIPIVLFVLLLSAGAIAEPFRGHQDSKQSKAVPLVAAKSQERELRGGESHAYEIMLAKGQTLDLAVDQHGIDVVVTVIDPDGKRFMEIDSPNGTEGPEHVLFIARTDGKYEILVWSLEKEANPGRYVIRVLDLRAATEKDRKLEELIRLENEAVHLQAEGKLKEAIPISEKSIELREQIFSGSDPDLVTTLNQLAGLYKEVGDYAKTKATLLRAKEIGETIFKPESLEITQILNNLAETYRITGDYTAAEPLFKRVLSTLERALGDSALVAITLNNLGAVYRLQGKFHEAEAMLLRSLTMDEKLFGKNSPNLASDLNNLEVIPKRVDK